MVVDHDAEELPTSTENVSASGAYCIVSRFIPPMTKVQIRLELPTEQGSRPLRCQGVIVRIDPPHASPQQRRYQVAIFFNDLSERDRAHLAHFVQQRLPQPSNS
jgi:hypothetical protein